MKKTIIISLLFAVGAMAMAQTSDSTVARTVRCAQEGNDRCQTLLGKWIFDGSHGYQQDYAKAVAWWLQAAKQNNDEATANLGFCYQFGWGVEADSTTAVRLFDKALKQGNTALLSKHDSLAAKGNVLSAMFLGRSYKTGVGVRRDLEAAQRYYQLAAEQGNVEAMREAAILMRSGKDDVRALALFKMAAEKGDVVATYYCGKMLCEGRGTARNAAEGIGYLQKAADRGYAAAQYELAEAYAHGTGIARDAAAALGWYRKAALGGNRAAWWQLAESYRLGQGTALEYEESLECYAKAWSEGYHNKLTMLVTDEHSEWKDSPFMHYLRGMRLLEVDANPDAALKEFSKLSKQSADRQVMEALCQLHPKYSKRNVKKAVKALQKLSPASRRATYELAQLQMRGEGTDKDLAKAEKTLAQLAKEGYVPAINLLANCYYEGHSFSKDKKKAILLYLQAEQQGRLNAVGAVRLAQAFRNGEGMKVDTVRAEKLEKYRAYDTHTLLEKVSVR